MGQGGNVVEEWNRERGRKKKRFLLTNDKRIREEEQNLCMRWKEMSQKGKKKLKYLWRWGREKSLAWT